MTINNNIAPNNVLVSDTWINLLTKIVKESTCWEDGSQTGLGQASGERRLGFVDKSQKGEPPLSSCSWHYIGKQKFISAPLVGVGFTCHSNSASWASSRGLGPYEYGMSQQ